MQISQAIILFGSWAQSIFSFFSSLGVFGLLFLGALDSSFLVMPFGNDLLLIALVTENPTFPRAVVYALTASVGSLIGVFIVDVLMRKAGEEGLEHFVKPKQMQTIKARIEDRAGWGVFLSTLLPPPFPFTAVVMTFSALQYSRKKLLLTVFSGRLVRFMIEAVLAIFFGKKLLAYINSKVIEYFVYAIIAIAIVGSVLSVIKWVSSRRGPSTRAPQPQERQA